MCALTTTPLFVALELLVECGYRSYLLAPNKNNNDDDSDNSDGSNSEIPDAGGGRGSTRGSVVSDGNFCSSPTVPFKETE